ncbi:MAG: hypothetical protein MUD01_12170 [Chloroflexaceae bacterium]|nr:hypothetical protein [Chloroflexaceae bacterium]
MTNTLERVLGLQTLNSFGGYRGTTCLVLFGNVHEHVLVIQTPNYESLQNNPNNHWNNTLQRVLVFQTPNSFGGQGGTAWPD